MHSTTVKKAFLLPALLFVVSLACTAQLTAKTPAEIPAIDIVVTGISTYQPALGTQQSTDAPKPLATPDPTIITPPSGTGTLVTFRPLTLIIPPDIASGTSGNDIQRVDRNDAVGWQKTPGHLQINLGDYYVLQGKTHQPQIYVYPAQSYSELVPATFESIRRVNNIIYGSGSPSADQLPAVPFFNARQVFASNIQVISFQNGRGVRFLTEYAIPSLGHQPGFVLSLPGRNSRRSLLYCRHFPDLFATAG